MSLEELEKQYENRTDEAFNKLQAAIMLLAQLEDIVTELGQDLQNLSQIMEEIISKKRSG